MCEEPKKQENIFKISMDSNETSTLKINDKILIEVANSDYQFEQQSIAIIFAGLSIAAAILSKQSTDYQNKRGGYGRRNKRNKRNNK